MDGNGDLRQDGQERDEEHCQRRQQLLSGRKLPHCRRTEAGHVVALLVHNALLDNQDDHRDQNDDHRQRARKARIGTYLIQEFLINDDRERRVALADQARRTEVSQRRHKDHQAAGEDCRHDDRERDLHHAPDPCHAEVFAGLLERGINAAQRTGDIQIDHRIQF